MIFLDYHPPAPTSAKAAKEQNKTRAKCAPTKPMTKTDDLSWQLKWLEEYDSLRREHQDYLQQSEENSNQRLIKIEVLEKEVEKIPELVAKIENSEKKIRKLEKKCQTNQMSTQTHKVKTIESSTQMDATTLYIDASTQTECVENADSMKITVSDNYVRNIHNHAQISASISNTQKFKFNCGTCGLATNKKSTYDYHKAENCDRKPEKNMKCPVCKSSFTYNTLRFHLNHYATGQHRPKGEHAKYTPSYHAYLLEQHKRLSFKK